MGGLSGQVESGDKLIELSATFNHPPGRESEREAAKTLDWLVFIGKAGIIALLFMSAFWLSDTLSYTHTRNHTHTLRYTCGLRGPSLTDWE